MGKEYRNVSAAEENKAIFRRYAEEVGNQQNFELVDEIFERHIAHQPDGSTLQRGPQDVKPFQGSASPLGTVTILASPFPERCAFIQAPREGSRIESYSPEFAEVEFCELRYDGVLRNCLAVARALLPI